jgi:hypothetical protein
MTNPNGPEAFSVLVGVQASAFITSELRFKVGDQLSTPHQVSENGY